MESLANLKKVNGSIGQVQSRLSSGKRINSAEDDTSGYALSKHLQSRVNGLSQALDNVSTAKNVLNIAEGGYQSQMNILQQIKENLTQAADGALSAEQRGAIGDRIDSLLEEFNDINDQTKYNGFVLFEEPSMVFQVGEETSDRFTVNFDNSTRSNVGETEVGSEIDLDSIVKSVTNNSQQTVAASGTFTLSNYTVGDNVVITLPDGTAVPATDDSGTPADASDDVINYTIDASGEITFTAAGTYDISHTYDSSDGASSDWNGLTQSEATTGIDVLDSAIKALAKTIQQVGDDQARLSSKEESLSLGISNTEATRSRIEDADFAKEQMSMMKLQILQQTSVSAFTQSNSAPQVVLSLFR
jgi:flagellin